MLPRLRIFVKKRGTRRTGAPWVGNLAEGLLSAGLVAVGAIGLAWLLNHVARADDAGRWPWLAMLIPVALIIYGAAGFVGLVWRSAISTERRAVVAQRATEWELPGVGDRLPRPALPAVPPIDTVIDSPGVRLAYRLPIDAASGWVSFMMAAVCLAWNILAAYCVVQFLVSQWARNPNRLAAALIVLVIASGIWMFVAIARQVLVHMALGATLLEVSQHPFYPGGTFHGFVSQTGHVHVRWLQVQLVCEEHAVYQQGTDTRRATNRVYRHVLISQRKFEIARQQAFEATFDITLPATAMHSFLSSHNAVVWSLVVCGRLTRWGDFERRFPVYIYPLRSPSTSVSSNVPLANTRS